MKDLKYNQIRLAQSTFKRYPILLQERVGGSGVSGGSLSIDDSGGVCDGGGGGGDGVIGYSVMNKSVKIVDHHHHHHRHPERRILLNRHQLQQHQHGTIKHITDVKNIIDAPRTNELLAYLIDMLDCRILKSFTFILLSVACFVNMFGKFLTLEYLFD
ncbi:unnamed protein product [Trichobilharzia regenti]|nr:unnamed protein product [Trichobilharzia regenti]